MSIRIKVVLPYLLLTLIVAITGIYVVTKLVSNSLEERLKNQLLEAGRVVSDNFARQELNHVRMARLVGYTNGMGEAILADDFDQILSLARPVSSENKVENLLIFNMQGEEILHMLMQTNSVLQDVTLASNQNNLSIVNTLLQSQDPNHVPQREFSSDRINNRYYYLTAIPLVANEEMIGVIVIGTSLDTIMPYLRSTSLAHVIIYKEDGVALASTIQAQGDDAALYPSTISIEKDMYKELLMAKELVIGENRFSNNSRDYSIAYGPLQVGNDRLAVFAVALPTNFVFEASSAGRTVYTILFTIAALAVIGLGVWIASLIIKPLYTLVKTSQAITVGDLTRRTGIRNKDEIGILARNFDEMTATLEQRTHELERTNAILEQMDRTKMSFIHVSAHELRTPLTLLQGYSQILDQKSSQDPELQSVARGILEGSNRMADVVNSMLDISRIDSQSLRVTPTELQLSLVIGKIHKTFKEALKERDLKFETKSLDDLPPIPGDPELVYKLFYNLVMNAIKFTPDGGKIMISGLVVQNGAQESQVEIRVQDTGIGIAPENKELVFEKFYQTGEVNLHSSGKTKFKGGGPGLGLAIARGIVQAHGGEIWLESPGYDEKKFPGTTFFVRLPVNGQGE